MIAARDHHALRQATGELVDFGPGSVGEVELLEQLVGRAPRFAMTHSEVAAVEVEVLADVERTVERIGLRDDADDLLCARDARPRRCRRPRATPAVGITRVVSMPTVVVLPAPFGPSRPKISPPRTSRSRLSTTRSMTPRPRKTFVRREVRIASGAACGSCRAPATSTATALLSFGPHLTGGDATATPRALHRVRERRAAPHGRYAAWNNGTALRALPRSRGQD